MGVRHRTLGVGVVEQTPFYMPVLMAVTVRAQAHKGTPDVLVIAHPGIGLDGARL
jgi:hypothetical protein